MNTPHPTQKVTDTAWTTKTVLCLLLALILSCGCMGCASSTTSTSADAQASSDAQTTTDASASSTAQDVLQQEISAFEIAAKQRELAKDNAAGYSVLDAGRGNPNWVNTEVRRAFSRFMDFALDECERAATEEGMAGQAQKDGIGERFAAAMDPSDQTDAFLLDAISYCTNTMGLNKDDLIKELADAIVGDYYPVPSRCLTNTEAILNAYLQSTLYHGVDLADQTNVFPTEGGSAAISYLFETLSHNKLLNPGDTIALATPIFSPYLEIPSVNNYDLVAIDVTSTKENDWDIDPDEIKKLEDPSIKAFFLVNPSNPASHALSQKTLDLLAKAVEKNPNLIIITDDVYGTFVDDFQTVYSSLPYNTILVYSYSKLYGATGWRIGLIAMNKKNVCDQLLGELSDKDKQSLAKEYSSVTNEPESLKFLDRIVADSRSIGLYHTSGLSTPSQVFMDLLSLSHLMYGEDDPYIERANQIVQSRYAALVKALGIEPDDDGANAKYYALVDVLDLAADKYGEDFASWLEDHKTEVEFLNDFAAQKGVVLLYGPGFKAPYGTVRVSLANLNAEDYTEIGKRLYELLDDYYAESGIALDEAA